MIFKEKSSYYSYGVSNSDISEEDIVNQTVIDLEASATYFVIKQFNDGIGCDLPNTIALCRNRLVWACTNGCVYTLVSNEQYNERTIFKVSEMIEPRLKSEKSMLYSRYESAIKHSYAFDCGDYYCLVVDNRIYVMDYNSYGYRYITSFSKSEDSNVQIPWYYWELPSFRKKAGKNDTNELTNILGDDGVHAVMMIDGCIVFVSYYLSAILNTKGLQDVIITDVLDFENTLDDTHDKCKKINNNKLLNTQIKEIGSSVSTKLFDFKSARYAKNIEGVSVGFGSNGGAPIMVEFVTDSGGNSEEIVIRNANIDERDAAFIRYRNFYPCMRAVRTFGLKFSCNGKLLIDGMNIQYRMLGGIK